MIFDAKEELKLNTADFPNYYKKDFDQVLEKLTSYFQNMIDKNEFKSSILFINNVEKFISKIEDINKLNQLIEVIKKCENVNIIVADDFNKLKNIQFDQWFKDIFSLNDGIWIGKGISEQSLFRISTITKDMRTNQKDNMGYYISENTGTLCKMIDFISKNLD